MRNVSRIILFGLIATALFIIFNCAGYLVISFLFSNNSTDNNPVQASNAGQGSVVNFATATPQLAIPSPPATPSSENERPAPTPIPLLPTVTAAPPSAQEVAIQPSDTPKPPTSTPPAQTSTPVALTPRPVAKTAAPGQLEVINHKSYVDTLGWFHIVGEVRNNTNTPMEYVEVLARLYNANNDAIGTKLTFTAPDTIFPGGTAPFDIIALRQSQWKNISNYSLRVKGELSKDLVEQKLILVSQNSSIRDNRLIVDGAVQNIGQTPALAKLIVTLYDADHNVINTGWSYADQGIIAANDTSTFEVKVDHNTDPNNFQYRIQIEEEVINTD